MAKVEKLSISLPRDMVQTIDDAIESGDYATTSEVVRDALRKWESDRAYEQAVKTFGLEELRRLAQEGADSGPSIEAEEVLARLHEKFARIAEGSAANEGRKLLGASRGGSRKHRKIHRQR